ncbi:hypothetical protein EC991_003317 [Linnemannia zychae]|nr:hypothetical protein EC991_003317 [Linnemannia zychae]
MPFCNKRQKKRQHLTFDNPVARPTNKMVAHSSSTILYATHVTLEPRNFCRKTTLIKHHRKEHLASATGAPVTTAVKGEPQEYSLYTNSLSSEHPTIPTGVAGDGMPGAAYFGMVPTSGSGSASSGSPGSPLDYYSQQQYGRAAGGAGAQHPQSPISPTTSPLSPYNSHGHPQHPYAPTPQVPFAHNQQQHQPLHLDVSHTATYQYNSTTGGNTNVLSSPLQTPSHEGSPTSPTSPLSPMTPLGHMGPSAHVVAAADSLAALGALAMDHLQNQQSSSSSEVLRSPPTSQQQYQQYSSQQQQQYQDYQAYPPSRHGQPSYAQTQQHYNAQQQPGCEQNTAGGYHGFSDPTADQTMSGVEYARVASNGFPTAQGIYQAYY